jgi:hypothetical protein
LSGTAVVESLGRTIDLTALRQVVVPAPGLIPAASQPIDASPAELAAVAPGSVLTALAPSTQGGAVPATGVLGVAVAPAPTASGNPVDVVAPPKAAPTDDPPPVQTVVKGLGDLLDGLGSHLLHG